MNSLMTEKKVFNDLLVKELFLLLNSVVRKESFDFTELVITGSCLV